MDLFMTADELQFPELRTFRAALGEECASQGARDTSHRDDHCTEIHRPTPPRHSALYPRRSHGPGHQVCLDASRLPDTGGLPGRDWPAGRALEGGSRRAAAPVPRRLAPPTLNGTHRDESTTRLEWWANQSRGGASPVVGGPSAARREHQPGLRLAPVPEA